MIDRTPRLCQRRGVIPGAVLLSFMAAGCGAAPAEREDASSAVEVSVEPAQTDSAARSAVDRWVREADAYLAATLTERGDMVVRWPDRRDPPIRVYLPPTFPGVTPRHQRAVEDAFRRWERVAEIPVDFVFSRDSAGTDVKVRWIRTFDVERAGQADVTWRSDGLIQRARLTLATHTSRSQPLTPDAVFTVALHEIGHLLGLGHSDHPEDVMAPSTGVHDLTARDRRTATMLYSLPPGPLGGG